PRSFSQRNPPAIQPAAHVTPTRIPTARTTAAGITTGVGTGTPETRAGKQINVQDLRAPHRRRTAGQIKVTRGDKRRPGWLP
ncbi:MAG: hypothetical protein ABSF34_14690, partial [Verrucomicrobiota bacterium]